ncbi:ABC transporter ATP-binding protein [Plantibacter sp. Mn2098]|uniref:ABC transporter ATP-binding protein n=1 Tax=Plantibacter sp. Mn2098 TaxID=3395266 RepID=UPI003BC8DC24
MSTTPIVEVNCLRKIYAGKPAVDGVSFDIQAGETFALLGPNGAGKSTTIEILEGYRSRDGGDVRVLGVDPAHGGLAWKAQLGIVLQSSAEAANVTVREQLTQFARYYAHPRGVDEVIEAVGLTAKAGTRIGKLSGGQRRRVDVALGVIGRPKLLFLDEPTTGFDPEARRQFWDLIRDLKHHGTAILLTTHYLDEAAQLADRAGVITGGRLVEIGAVDEIGGPDARVPVVRWRDAAGLHEERTTEPALRVAELVRQAGGEPRDLEVIRPSLEDVYLGLVARVGVGPSTGSGTGESTPGVGPSTSSGTGAAGSGTGESTSGAGPSTSSGTGASTSTTPTNAPTTGARS